MNLPIAISMFAFFSFCGCNTKDKSESTTSIIESFSNSDCEDTANSNIYEFVNIVIRNQSLDTTYGLKAEPLKHMDMAGSDSTFLQQHLMIDSNRKNHKLKRSNVVTIGVIDSCLTQDDINFMLNQKIKSINFQWNSNCAGLKDINQFGEKYVFSVPLFSKDKTKFLIAIENYKAGGIILLYKKENKSWTSTIESQWIH